ncbi:MAG: dolichyl-phosphate beta-glucosyltransferase [bacterium]
MYAENFSRKKNDNPSIDVVIPVYNEEKILQKSVLTLSAFLKAKCPYKWRIIIADNASKDTTPVVATNLAAEMPNISYLRIPYKGRGRALREAWMKSDADIVTYMDVDLSTDLNCFMPLIEPLARGEADVALGSRLKKGAQVQRGLKREILSRGYIGIMRLMMRCSFTDAQCGFKAATRHAVQTLVPLIENQGWFFDAELLLLAEHYGFRLNEVAVKWDDDPDSRVKILQTVSEHFIGLVRMRLAFSTGFAPLPCKKPAEQTQASYVAPTETNRILSSLERTPAYKATLLEKTA